MQGKQVCHIHGGKSPSGIVSPHFKHGRYSKVIPTHLTAYYEQAQQDPDLLGIKADIALQDALLYGSLDAMSRGEAGELWVKLKENWRLYQAAKHSHKKDENATSEAEALAMIGWLIQEGYQDYMARIELRQMLQERAKLVEAEGKRLERAQQTLNTNQAMSLVHALLAAVRANVSDYATLGQIQAEFGRLIGLDDTRRIDAARTD